MDSATSLCWFWLNFSATSPPSFNMLPLCKSYFTSLRAEDKPDTLRLCSTRSISLQNSYLVWYVRETNRSDRHSSRALGEWEKLWMSSILSDRATRSRQLSDCCSQNKSAVYLEFNVVTAWLILCKQVMIRRWLISRSGSGWSRVERLTLHPPLILVRSFSVATPNTVGIRRHNGLM